MMLFSSYSHAQYTCQTATVINLSDSVQQSNFQYFDFGDKWIKINNLNLSNRLLLNFDQNYHSNFDSLFVYNGSCSSQNLISSVSIESDSLDLLIFELPSVYLKLTKNSNSDDSLFFNLSFIGKSKLGHSIIMMWNDLSENPLSENCGRWEQLFLHPSFLPEIIGTNINGVHFIGGGDCHASICYNDIDGNKVKFGVSTNQLLIFI